MYYYGTREHEELGTLLVATPKGYFDEYGALDDGSGPDYSVMVDKLVDYSCDELMPSIFETGADLKELEEDPLFITNSSFDELIEGIEEEL